LLNAAVENACLGPLGDEVTVHFPWGPLLDAIVGDAPHALAAVASLARPDGSVRVLVSATEHDARPPLSLGELVALVPAYREAGLSLTTVRLATWDDIVASQSSWGKRLGAGRTRAAFVLEAVRR